MLRGCATAQYHRRRTEPLHHRLGDGQDDQCAGTGVRGGAAGRPRKIRCRDRTVARISRRDHRRPLARPDPSGTGRGIVRRTGSRRRETQYRAADAELWYDTIVAFGELLSTTVVSEYLASAGVANHWVDMRRALVTQQRHKDASVDIDASAFRLLAEVEGAAETIFVGQGFIGGAPDGTTTTLGREGSDYSAGRGGQYSRRGVDVGVEGCRRCAQRRPQDLPRRRADQGAELPRYDRAGVQRCADHPPQDDQAVAEQELSRSTSARSATSASPER